MIFPRRALLALPVIALGASAALAHGGASGIVKMRMDAMEAIGSQMKAVGGMLKSGELDPERATAAGQAIAGHGGDALTKLFPEGSNAAPSEASATIWQEWDRFSAYADDLEQAATAMAETAAAGGDRKAVAAAFGALAGTCKACHESFRLRK